MEFQSCGREWGKMIGEDISEIGSRTIFMNTITRRGTVFR